MRRRSAVICGVLVAAGLALGAGLCACVASGGVDAPLPAAAGLAGPGALDAFEPEPGASGAASGVVCPGDDIDLSEREIPSVSVEEASEMVAANPRLVVLDVRTPVEYADGHLAGAVNIDFQSGTFAEDVTALDVEGEYLVYCRSGVRSALAVATMQDLGFVRVTNMLGGYQEWTFQKRPTEK